MMTSFFAIAGTGIASVLLHPLRSFVTVMALVAILLPYLVGLGISKGLEVEAEASAQYGADLYVSGKQFGRTVPLPLQAATQIEKIDGVVDVSPRIVGEVFLGKEREHAVLVGISAKEARSWSTILDGELPAPGKHYELVVGNALARRLNLHIGSMLPPFYRTDREGERVFRVVGLFKADAPIWQTNLMLTSFESAAAIFDQTGLATDLLVYCQPGQQGAVSRAIMQNVKVDAGDNFGPIRTAVTSREDLRITLPHGLRHRDGVFQLHFVLAFVIGILVILVTSGFGLSERRIEIGILKATGWQTDEILLRATVESVCLSMIGACTSLLLAWIWLRLGNGFAIAGYFLPGVSWVPEIRVPFRLTPLPMLLAFALSLLVILTGTLYSAWRAAIVPPRIAMR
jgi:ABC-type lipoprotein release transport system permease subunit